MTYPTRVNAKRSVTELKALIAQLIATTPLNKYNWPPDTIENLFYHRTVTPDPEVTLQVQIFHHTHVQAILTFISKKFIYKLCPSCQTFKDQYNRYQSKPLCKSCQRKRAIASNAKRKGAPTGTKD